ncbi:LCP family protein [Micromonosporaceae bacterium Da 78-11]
MFGDQVPKRKSLKRRAPMWARLCTIFGCILMVISGGAIVSKQVLIARYAGSVTTQDLFGDPAAGASKVSEIKGPLNILLVGIDPRDANTAPLSDSIIVAHIPKDMNEAYLFSIPRDLYVDIPAFEKTNFKGTRAKINAAMSYGSAIGNGQHDAGQGFELLAKTVSQLTGIKKFDAGAIINFGGFKKIVDAMGGVTMTVDQNVKSEHLQPNGDPRPRLARCADNKCEHPYIGPQKTYKKGTYHLEGWEALDYVRQRYTLPRGDYDRQRHQQQFVKAMAQQALSKNVVTNPATLDKVLKAAGSALVFDGKGHNVVDWGFALKGVSSQNMTLIKLPGSSLFEGEGKERKYLGEQLDSTAPDFFSAVAADGIGSFIFDHPGYLNKV